jgi:TDG/mug DNA glycosylase family protein
VKRYTPRYLAIVGIGAYRTAFDRPKAKMGLQEETIGATKIWVLPNPSGPERELPGGAAGGVVRGA